MGITTVDIGNTAIKISGQEDCRNVTLVGSIAEATGMLKEEKDVAYSTTRELTAEERQAVEKAGWWEFSALRELPVALHYDTPETLGPDRLAAAIGASVLFPGKTILVADLGTALTTDVMHASEGYLGGNISPGMKMRFEALNKFTSRLPLVEKGEGSMKIGRDTESAIRAGVRRGLAYEIAGAFFSARKEYGCGMIVLTGGDARTLEPEIRYAVADSCMIEMEPHLVHVGLKEVYKYNHDKEN